MKTRQVPLERRNREIFFSLISAYLPRLHQYTRQELADAEAVGDLMPGELSPEDVVDEVVLRAYREFAKRPVHKIASWLTKLTREHLRAEVRRLRSEHRRDVHTEEDIPETPPREAVSTLGDEVLDFYEADEDLKMEDILPDYTIITPEQEAEIKELRLSVSAALASMPRQWRRALLGQARGLDGARLAGAIGRSEQETERIVEYAREYLRQKLMEAGND